MSKPEKKTQGAMFDALTTVHRSALSPEQRKLVALMKAKEQAQFVRDRAVDAANRAADKAKAADNALDSSTKELEDALAAYGKAEG